MRGMRSICHRFARAAIQQFIQARLLPERDPGQYNHGDHHIAQHESKHRIACNRRVKIQAETGRRDQMDKSNHAAQIFVTHNFLLARQILKLDERYTTVYSKQIVAYCSWTPIFCHFAPRAYNCGMNAPRQMPAITISAALAGFQTLGFDSDALLGSLGGTRAHLEDPFGTVPESWLVELFEYARARDPRPDLPARVGLATPFGAWGLIDYLIGSAETLGADLIALSLFFHLVLTRTRLELNHDGGDFIWFVNEPPTPTDSITEQLGFG